MNNFAMIPRAALTADIGAAAFQLYVHVRARYRPGEPTWNAENVLCAKLGITPRTYRRDMSKLKAAGLVDVTPDPEDGRRNTYRFPAAKGGFVKVALAVLECGDVSASGLLCYVILRSYDGLHVPTIKAMAARFGVSERTLKRGLVELTGAGLVITTKRRQSNWQWRNVYDFPVLYDVPKVSSIFGNPESAQPELAPCEGQNWPVVEDTSGTSLRKQETVLQETVKQETGSGATSPAAVVITAEKPAMNNTQTDRTTEPTTTVPAKSEDGRKYQVTPAWVPAPEMFRWAAATMPGLDIDRSTRRFRDWHDRKGRLLSDIAAEWKKWLRKDYSALSPEERAEAAAVAARWDSYRQAERYRHLKGIAEMYRAEGFDYPEPEPPAAPPAALISAGTSRRDY